MRDLFFKDTYTVKTTNVYIIRLISPWMQNTCYSIVVQCKKSQLNKGYVSVGKGQGYYDTEDFRHIPIDTELKRSLANYGIPHSFVGMRQIFLGNHTITEDRYKLNYRVKV